MNKSLEQLRREIDQIDDHVVDLLNKRAGLAIQVGEIKQSQGGDLYVPSRERDVLNRMIARNNGPLSHAAICRIYAEVMAASLALEHHDRVFAGGATNDELTGAVSFITGGNADLEIHADPAELINIFARTNDSLLIISDSWFLDMAATISTAKPDIQWKGFWSIPIAGENPSSRYHVFNHKGNKGDALRPLTVCCLLSMAGNEWLETLDCITDVPVRSAQLIPLKSEGGRGILQIRMEGGNSSVVQELARQLSVNCEAVWIM